MILSLKQKKTAAKWSFFAKVFVNATGAWQRAVLSSWQYSQIKRDRSGDPFHLILEATDYDEAEAAAADKAFNWLTTAEKALEIAELKAP